MRLCAVNIMKVFHRFYVRVLGNTLVYALSEGCLDAWVRKVNQELPQALQAFRKILKFIAIWSGWQCNCLILLGGNVLVEDCPPTQ